MKVFLASYLIFPELRASLEREGQVVLIGNNPFLPCPEASHADMQVYDRGDGELIVKNGFDKDAADRLARLGFTITYTGSKTYQKYPECASMNVLKCGNYILHKFTITDPLIVNDISMKNQIAVSVSQGYTGCSSVYVDFLDLMITGDPSVISKASSHSFNLYKIDEAVTDKILLPGHDHGFIGGVCGYDDEDRTLYVNGDLEKTVPDLFFFLRSAGISIRQCDKRSCLFDIGGIKIIRSR